MTYADRDYGRTDQVAEPTRDDRGYYDQADRPSQASPAWPTQSQQPERSFSSQRPPVMPAHPLPAYRSNKLDYDRYLERSTSKFKIFSAESRRQRHRTLATAAAVLALVAIIVIWAVLSQSS